MADNKTHPVIFNDDHIHDGIFKREQYAELNDEQYKTALTLKCGYDSTKPLITDTEKREKAPASQTETKAKNENPKV